VTTKTKPIAFEIIDLKTGKVLAPGHGFNSERSKQSENGGRP